MLPWAEKPTPLGGGEVTVLLVSKTAPGSPLGALLHSRCFLWAEY